MSIKNFKMVGEDESAYHIGSPSGKTFPVSKKGLSDKAHSIIKSLTVPHMADGGTPPTDFTVPTPEAGSIDITKNINTEPQPTQTPQPAAQDPYQQDMQQVQQSLQQGEDLGNQAIDAQKKVGAAAGQIAQGLDVDAAQQQDQAMNQRYQENLTKQDARRAQIEDAIANGKIDPNRVIANMSTGGKFLTGIGLLLGGLAAPAYGGKNPAMDVLNNSIDRDIDAQKNAQGQNRVLWDMVRGDSQDDQEAALKFRGLHLQMATAKLNALQSQASSPAQQMALNNGKIQLQQESAKNDLQIAAMKSLQSPNLTPVDKVNLLQKSGQITPQEVEQANKELTLHQGTEDMRAGLTKSFNDLNNQFMRGLLSPSRRQSDVQTWAGKLEHLSEGRFNLEQAKEQIEAFLPNKTDWDADTRKEKLSNMNDFMNSLNSYPKLEELHVLPQRQNQSKTARPGFNKSK